MPIEPITTSVGIAQAVLPAPHPVPLEIASANNDSFEDTEILQASIKAGSVAQIVVAVIAVIGLIYLLKVVMVTTLFSILLAFVLEPLVSRLGRIRIPRAVGALLAVALLVGLAGGLTYFFYSRAVDFATQLPKYSGKIDLPLRTYGHRPAKSRKVRARSSPLPM
jgi:predicted PurR-regulated permease PerM